MLLFLRLYEYNHVLGQIQRNSPGVTKIIVFMFVILKLIVFLLLVRINSYNNFIIQMERKHLKQLAFMLHLWAATLFLFAAIMLLIIVEDKTGFLQASCFIAGSILFAISNSIQTYLHSGTNRILQSFFILANLMFLAASITFLPSINHAIIGNWLFEIASWIVVFLQIIKLRQLYLTPTKTWELQVLYRVLTGVGACLFVVGNCLLINNVELYLQDAFIVFTTGCTCFVVGGSCQVYLDVNPPTPNPQNIGCSSNGSNGIVDSVGELK